MTAKVTVIEVVQCDLFQSPAHIASYTVVSTPNMAKSATGGRGVGENPPLTDYAAVDLANSKKAVHAAIGRLDGSILWMDYLQMVNYDIYLKELES